MAILRLKLAYDPRTLLEAAAEVFLRPAGGASPAGVAGAHSAESAFPTPPYLLALRQGGIRDDLLELAARREVAGWFDPPLCTFQELPQWLGVGPRRTLGAFERVALIGELVRRVDGEVLARLHRPEAYLAALDRFFGELAAESVAPEALEAAQARSGERDEFAIRRDREVAAVYRSYVKELEEKGRRDGRDWLADCAACVRADPAGLSRRLGGRREIRILGLQDLRGGWRALLAALRESPALDSVEIYTSVTLELSELGVLVERLPEEGTLAGGLFGGAGLGEVLASAGELTGPGPGPKRPEAEAEAVTFTGPGPVERVGDKPTAGRGRGKGSAGELQHDLFFDIPPTSGGERPDSGSGLDAGSAPDSGSFMGAGDKGWGAWRVGVLVAPDAQREVEEVARRVRELVDAGVAPHRMAVVARESRPQLPMAVAALRRFGLPVTARERTGLAEVPVVRAILALLDVAADGWSRHGLVELADQPYLAVELDAGVINTVGYRERVSGLAAWDEALAGLLAEAQARERAREAAEGEEGARGGGGRGNGHARPLPPAWRVERTRAQLGALRERVGALDEARPLRAWLAWLREVLAEDRWELERRVYAAPAERTDVVRLDLAGLKALGAIATEWAEALETWGAGREEALDVATFAARLRDELDADVALWTETRRGVQVLEGLAAAYRAFEHVFVVGLEAGRFPRAPSRSPLLDTAEREALIAAGLPLDGREAWDARERELFRGVVAAGSPGSLTVSYSRLDAAAREVAKSSFVEALEDVAQIEQSELPVARVITPGLPLCPPERLADAQRVARMERRRQAGQEFPGNGTIEDPALVAWLAEQFGDERVWSPTQLEEFAKCPWAYFCGRVLRLERKEDPDTELDPAVRGGILHDALYRFFEKAVARAGGQPVLLDEDDLEWAEPELMQALDDAIAAAGEESWLGHPALRPARQQELRRTLRRYLQFEIEHTAALHKKVGKYKETLRTGVVEHEKVFDDVVLERDGIRFRFRGRIDRVERGVDERVAGQGSRYVAAVDYKSSEASTPGAGSPKAWEEGIVLQVPLYAHALAQLEPGAEVARVEYRALGSRKIVHSLELVRYDRASGQLVEPEEAAEKLEQALATAARHVAAIRAGRFPASPAGCSDCAPWCVGRDICRAHERPRGEK